MADHGPSAPQEVLGSPASGRVSGFYQRHRGLLLGAAVCAALSLAGARAWLVRDSVGPADVVAGMYLAQQNGDCRTVADSFHYEDPEARAVRLDVCRRTSRNALLVGYEVTDVEASPNDVPPVEGASDVARVGYTLTGEFDGTRGTVSGTWVVAKFDVGWKVPIPQ